MAEVKHTNFLTIQGWMVTDLHLSGGELLAYAMVHQFSQGEAGRYTGGPKYLASWVGCTENTARIYLHSLVEKGLLTIIEPEGKVTFRHYVVNPLFAQDPLRKSYPYENRTPTNFDNTPLRKSDPEYNNNHKYIKRESNNAHTHARPTLAEVAAYCEERKNGIDPGEFIDHYTSNGWKVGKAPMVDWKAAVRQWERRRKNEAPAPGLRGTPSPRKKDDAFERTIAQGVRLGIITPETDEQ